MTTIQIQGVGAYELPIEKNEALISWLLENGAILLKIMNSTTTTTESSNLVPNSPIPV